MCDSREFISGSDVTEQDVDDFDAGLLTPWRVAADGTQWYRRAVPETPAEWPEIHGGPGVDDDDADDHGDDHDDHDEGDDDGLDD